MRPSGFFRLEDFVQDNQTKVFVNPDVSPLLYTDGIEVETRIHRILKSVHDKSSFSKELLEHISDWPTEYHFSPKRHNLLRHVPIKEGDRILELGAGCGSITRQLGETGARVMSVEGSLLRAKCAALRCEDMPNVSVYCADFGTLDASPSFDFVTLIGVLEYAPLYFKGDEPIKEYLKLAARFLKPDGVLILAIENQLGAKYFCGFPEDHAGKPYFGLEDRYSPSTAQTLGYAELGQVLENAGFHFVEFQYPFPDYKLPELILMESALTRTDFVPVELIIQTQSRAYGSNDFHPSVDEQLLWPIIARNKLTQYFSNSFLVFAGQSPLNFPASMNQLLAISYNLDRARDYQTQTNFGIDLDEIKVSKRRLSGPEMSNRSDSLVYSYKDEVYIVGNRLDIEIAKAIAKNDSDRVASLFRLWVDFLDEQGIDQRNDEKIEWSLMKPEFIDCLPWNLIVTRDGLQYVDREWRFEKPFTFGCLLLRYLKGFARQYSQFLDHNFKVSGDPLTKLTTVLGLDIDRDFHLELQHVHSEINSRVYPWKVKSRHQHIIPGLSQIRSMKKRLRDCAAYAKLALKALIGLEKGAK